MKIRETLVEITARLFAKPLQIKVDHPYVFEDRDKVEKLKMISDRHLQMKLIATRHAYKEQKYMPMAYSYNWGILRIEQEIARRAALKKSGIKSHTIEVKLLKK